MAGAVRLEVAVVVACGALATGAHAASVALVRDGVADPDLDRYALSFQAAPGEANRLTLSQSADGLSWSFHDAGAVMVPGANCAAAPDAVVCALAPTVYYRALVTGRVDLGDADDTADVATQTRQEIDAGSGDDALTLHAGSGTVSLGPGRDAAVADAGSWDVDGGPGPDATGASGTAEVQVNYGKAPGPVSVSLEAQANDGTAGEGDDVGAGVTGIFASAYGDVLDASAAPGAVAVTAFDGDDIVRGAPAGGILDGGAGDDVLVGSGGHDILIGDEGDDQLFGGAGDDGLSGGAGRNLVDGGAGGDSYNIASASRDTIRARDATTDSVECLTLPRVLDVDPTDVLKSCAPRVVAPREATARLRAHRLRRRPRGRDLTASFVTHRARPPASERTTLWAFRLR